MPVYQTNLWLCDVCGATHSSTEEIIPYSSPVVVPIDDHWDYVIVEGKEILACPVCFRKHR